MNYEKIVDLMQRNDPNGEYNLEGIQRDTWTYLDILQAWYYDLKAAQASIPAWLVFSINWLDSQLA